MATDLLDDSAGSPMGAYFTVTSMFGWDSHLTESFANAAIASALEVTETTVLA